MESFGDVNSLIDGITTGPILNPRGISSVFPSGGHCFGVSHCQTFGRKFGTTSGSQTQMDANVNAKFRSKSDDSGNESSKSSSSRETIGMCKMIYQEHPKLINFPDAADDYQQQIAENRPKKRVTFSEHVRARIYISRIHRGQGNCNCRLN